MKKTNASLSLNAWMEENGKVKVLSTISMIGDLVREIGQDRVDGLVLITGELDSHSYELVKGDDEKLKRADLIFYNGLGLEHGAGLSHFLHNEKKAASLGEGVRKIAQDRILTINGTTDPHIWMDISLWMLATHAIVVELCRFDPEGSPYYKANAEALRSKMQKVHVEILTSLKSIPSEKRYLVTSHDAFNYFARIYLADSESEESWQKRFKAPEGLAPEGQLSPLDIHKIIAHLKQYNIQVIFPESNVSQDSIKKITSSASQMGLAVKIAGECLYGDAGCPNCDKAENGYLLMMQQNAAVICKYLR